MDVGQSLDGIILSKYWNTNGIGTAIVAVRGFNNDVAVYIGGSIEGAQHEEIALEEVRRSGAKLQREEAFGMLPRLEEFMTEAGLHYRP